MVKTEGDCNKQDLTQELWHLEPLYTIKERSINTEEMTTMPKGEREILRHTLETVGEPDFSDAEIEAYHVSDDVKAILSALKSGISVAETRPTGTLGGGLYASAVPSFWANRSETYQNFWNTLTSDDREQLFDWFINKELFGKYPKTSLLSDLERENLIGFLNRWRETGDQNALYFLRSYQPYVLSWANAFQDLGFEIPKPPVTPIHLRGKFVDVTEASNNDVLLRLADEYAKRFYPDIYYDLNDRGKIALVVKELGYSGMFTRSGFNTAPEIVVWDNDAICAFDSWTNEKSKRCQKEREEKERPLEM